MDHAKAFLLVAIGFCLGMMFVSAAVLYQQYNTPGLPETKTECLDRGYSLVELSKSDAAYCYHHNDNVYFRVEK